jgi:hypothetical protein
MGHCQAFAGGSLFTCVETPVSIAASQNEYRLQKNSASRSSQNRLLERSINASFQSSLSRMAAQVWSASSSKISRARRALSARPLRGSPVEFHTFGVRQYDRVLHEPNHAPFSVVTVHSYRLSRMIVLGQTRH